MNEQQNIKNRSFSQAIREARQVLPKLCDSPDMQSQALSLAESLRDYIRMLEDGNTTAVDMGIDTRNMLREIAEEIGDIADKLAPDTPEVRAILEGVNYYESFDDISEKGAK